MVDQTLYIGPGVDGTHRIGRALTDIRLTPYGFRGAWAFSSGGFILVDRRTEEVIPDPRGYFCARRRDATHD